METKTTLHDEPDQLIEEIENAIIIAKSAGCSNTDIIFAVEQLLELYRAEA